MRTTEVHLHFLTVVIGLSLCARAGAQTITWTSIGPGGGGWITCLTAHPTDPDIVYAGCDVGGVYRSTDAGLHWVRCTEGLTADYTEHIVIDPTSPDVVYAGGCGGVFRSAHAGAAWTWLRNGFPEPTDGRYSASVGALVMRPDDHLTLYAGIGYPRGNRLGNGMIYRTDDGGESWALLDGIARLADDACFCDLAIRPDTPDVMLAATSRGLFRSEDAGETWARAGSGLPEARVSDIAISPTSPDRVYVTVRTPAGEPPWRGGVWRSDDGGLNFASVSEGLPQIVGKPGAHRALTSNFLKIAVDPTDAELIYAASTSWVGAGLYRSSDGGGTWERVTHRGNDGNMQMGWITMGGLPGLKCVSISPVNPARVWIAGSMRLWMSDDGGASWDQRYTEQVRPGWWRGTGLETTCLDSITVDPTDSGRIYLGYADIGLLTTDDAGESFARRVEGIPWCGDMAPVVVDPERPERVWCGMGKGNRHNGGVAMSEDRGLTWTVVGSAETGLPDATTVSLVLDATSPVDSRVLYVTSAGNGVYKSSDGGATWRSASDGLPLDGLCTPRALAISPHDPRVLVVRIPWSKEDPMGGVYGSDDAGGSWHKLNSRTELPDLFGLCFDPRDAQVMFAACRRHYSHAEGRMFAGGIYRSEDVGVTWEQVLDDRFAAGVLVSPADSRIVYATLTAHPYHDHCKGGGVMRSADGGDTWRAENLGLTVTQVGTIICDPQVPEVLYVGTGGHGAFRGVDHGVEEGAN